MSVSLFRDIAEPGMKQKARPVVWFRAWGFLLLLAPGRGCAGRREVHYRHPEDKRHQRQVAPSICGRMGAIMV
jgi:hypothetical protein